MNNDVKLPHFFFNQSDQASFLPLYECAHILIAMIN